MKPETYTKRKNVLPRLKVWLLQGNSITHLQALKLFKTTRLAEYIRILRREGMKIETVLESSRGSVYGVYRLVQKPKVDRIKTRAYMNQV